MIARFFIFIPACILSFLLLAFATPAFADTCPSSGVIVDANNNITGTCTPATTATPPVSSTPGNGGIFSCNAPAGGSIGSRSAIGGTFVPVADAAVELNTGILVYKECILGPLFNQEKQAATVAIASNNYKMLSTGRDGNPRWVVNYGNERAQVSDSAVVDTFNSGIYKTISPAYQNQVQSAVLRNYQYQTRAPQNALTCPYQGDWGAVLSNPTQNFSWDAVFDMANPACDPVYAYTTAQDMRDANIAAAQDQWQTQLGWNQGLYSATDNGKYNGNVVVPGLFLGAVGTQSLTSGFRQLENANDIGQMVGSFFSGIGSTLLAGPQSVAAVQQAYGNAVQQQQGSLIDGVVNTALTNLNQILNWEQQYNAYQQQMAGTISGAITQLRAAEGKCWQLIQQNVCSDTATSSASGVYTCTGKNSSTLTIATSTTFSNAIITQANFATLAQTLSQRIDISNQNLVTINSIINGAQSSDPTARNTALQQLNIIVSANPPVLHTQQNLTQAQGELQQLQAAITDSQSGAVSTAIHRWAGDDSQGNTGTIAWNGNPSSDAGWCNVPVSGTPASVQQQTLSNWTIAWTK